MPVVLIVLIAAGLHASWNALVSPAGDRVAIVVGESLSPARVGGVRLISAGLFTLAVGPRGASRRAVGLAFATGLTIAAYTVCDGVGVRHSGTPTGHVNWLIATSGTLTALTIHARRTRAGLRTSARALALPALIAAVFSIVAYGLVLWAQTRGALAVVAGLRETSVVFAALIGALLFREPLPARRVIASVLVALGGVALALG